MIPGLGERVIYRELFPKGLTLLDLKQITDAGLGHVTARQELRAIGPSMAQALQSLLEDLQPPKSGNEDGRQRLGKARKSQGTE